MGGGSQVLSGGNQPGGGGSVSAPARQVSNLTHFFVLLRRQAPVCLGYKSCVFRGQLPSLVLEVRVSFSEFLPSVSGLCKVTLS